MKHGFTILIIALIGFVGFNLYDMTKTAQRAISKKTETINLILNGEMK